MDRHQVGGWCVRWLAGDPGCAGISDDARFVVADGVERCGHCHAKETTPGRAGRDCAAALRRGVQVGAVQTGGVSTR